MSSLKEKVAAQGKEIGTLKKILTDMQQQHASTVKMAEAMKKCMDELAARIGRIENQININN